jgi:hypothetical protein
MRTESLVDQFVGMSRVPPRGSAEFSTWIEQQDFLEMLAGNAVDTEVVLYASFSPVTYLHSVLVPLKAVRAVNIKDLLGWNHCTPYNSWGVSWSPSKGGRVTQVRLSPPLEHSGSKTIDQGEQIVFARRFVGRQEDQSYIEMAHTLTHPYDIHYVPERHAYCRYDDNGDLEDVVRVISLETEARGGWSGRIVTIRRDFLDRHLFVSGSALVRLFDSTRVDHERFSSWGNYETSSVNDAKKEIYGRLGKKASVGSFLRGAQIVRCSHSRKRMLRLMASGWRQKPKRYASFIAQDFKNQVVRRCSCDPRKLASYFITSPLPFETTPTFFRREVLLKYKSDPDKYQLSDHAITCRNAWHLETYGINDAGQVHSYLAYLSRLPYSEQLYWQSFNEVPRAPISETTYRREFLGEFVADENPLLNLKKELRKLNEKAPALWTCKDERLFETVHLPVTSSEREWSGEILELSKLMVEGLEVAYLRRKAVEAGVAEVEKMGSIALGEAVLRRKGWEDDAVNSIVAPLREIQMLRTKLRGHASGRGTRSIVAKIINRHGSYAAHFGWLTSESEASIRRLIECADRGLL